VGEADTQLRNPALHLLVSVDTTIRKHWERRLLFGTELLQSILERRQFAVLKTPLYSPFDAF
jgi:hypothetical protein